MKKKFLLFAIIISLIIGVFLLFKLFIKIEGEYTGYKMILVAKYEGYGFWGQDLGRGIKIKIFNISENDILYEPFMGGLWELNVDEEVKGENNNMVLPLLPNYRKILEIVELKKYEVLIKNKDEYYNIKYNKKFEIPSGIQVFDGINYNYYLKIIK